MIGIVAGLTTTLSRLAAGLHHLLCGQSALSASAHLGNSWLALVPACGGLLLGAGSRMRLHQLVDPIEANALACGRMSVRDSHIIGAQMLCSNGCGVSVGREAG